MPNNLPYPFDFYRLIFKEDYLHFGYWSDSPEITLEQAQENLFKLIIKHIPNKSLKILDVGCGLGNSSFRLAQMGHEVVGIAPSSPLIELAFLKYRSKNLTFINCGFLEYADRIKDENLRFDILLFQESLQYLRPLDRVFAVSREILKHKGRIVLCDEILNDTRIKEMTAVHPLKDIKSALLENGFCIKKIADIGKNVSPTCDQIISRLKKNSEHLAERDEGGYVNLLEGWKNQRDWYQSSQFSYIVMNIFKDDIYLKACEEGDEKDILPLFNEVFQKNRTLDHWNWKYGNNPCGCGVAAVAVDFSGNIAGHLSAYPVSFFSRFSDSGSFVALQAGDVMTLKSFRNIGIGTTSILSRINDYFSNKFCIDRYPFFYGFNTGNMRKFAERYLGYEYIDIVPFYTLSRYPLIQSGIRRLKRLFLEKIRIKEINTPDSDLDNFFEKTCLDYGMITIRDHKYLKWRYFEHPDNRYFMYGMYFRGRLSGWAVFRKKGTMMIMGDFMFEKLIVNKIRLLLESVFEDHPEVTEISAWCSHSPQWCGHGLLSAGFQLGNQPDNLAPCFNIFDKAFTKNFFQDNFYYTMGDSDLF